ncbi:MAG: flavodoxin family protein [Candidatus Bathyarchaeia archaeon]
MKVIGLSTGRIGGNCEILLKEALMTCEEFGAETEMIRAMELDVRPCRGCESCTMAMAKGEEPKCVMDDDVPWVLDKILLDEAAVIVGVPTYHLRSNGYFEIINERMLPVIFKHPEILKKNKVGAIIAVGGGEPEWTPLTLLLANIFMQHVTRVVDQMLANFCPRPGQVLLYPEYIERARKLGRNVVNAMNMPISEVKYVGERKDTACPVCHCDILRVHAELPEVFCPVCWTKGVITVEDGKMGIKWNEESVKYPRFSEKGVFDHLEFIKKNVRYYYDNLERVKGLSAKYAAYSKILKP